MGVKAVLDSVDDVPEAVRSLYKQEGEKFVLDVEGIDDHPQVRGVVTAHKTTKQARDKLKGELEELRNRYSWVPEDFDAEQLQALKDAAEGKGGKPTDEQIQAIRTKVQEAADKKYGGELSKRDERIAKLEGGSKKMAVDRRLKAGMEAAHIADEHREILLPHLKSLAKIEFEETEDGLFEPFIDSDMGHVTLEKFVQEWAGSEKGKPYVAKSTGPDAKGGKGGGADGKKTVSRSTFNGMSQRERAEFSKAGGKVVDD